MILLEKTKTYFLNYLPLKFESNAIVIFANRCQERRRSPLL